MDNLSLIQKYQLLLEKSQRQQQHITMLTNICSCSAQNWKVQMRRISKRRFLSRSAKTNKGARRPERSEGDQEGPDRKSSVE